MLDFLKVSKVSDGPLEFFEMSENLLMPSPPQPKVSQIPGILTIIIAIFALVTLLISVTNLTIQFNDRSNVLDACLNNEYCLGSFITDIIACISALCIILIVLTYLISLSSGSSFLVNYKFNTYAAWPFVALVFVCFLSKVASQVTMYYYEPSTTDNDNIMFPMYTTSSVLMFICSLVLMILLGVGIGH